MAKRGGFSGRSGGMGGANMGQLMKQAQKMQQDMVKMQEELEDKEVEASVGGGAVRVKATCKHKITEVKIKPEVIDPDDIEMLEDLILTAVNEAMKKADEESASAMNGITGGMPGGGIPGLF